MSSPPIDRTEYWIRFVCAFLFFGFLIALGGLRFIDSTGLPFGIAIWFLSTIGISLFAARVGDDAWHQLLDYFRWWP